MNRLNARCAALLATLFLALGIGAMGCDQAPNAAGVGSDGLSAKIESSARWIFIPPPRR